MPIAFVRTTQQATGGGSSLVITLSGAATVNNLLVVGIKTTGVASSFSVTDNASTPNVYAFAGAQTSVASVKMAQYYGVQITGGATTVTVSWSGFDSARITVDEYSGTARTNATVFDVASTGGTTASTSGSVTTLVPASAGELIAACIAFSGVSNITAGTGYTMATTQTNGSSFYRLSSTTSETAPITWTTSSNWAEVAAAYKPYATDTSSMLMLF